MFPSLASLHWPPTSLWMKECTRRSAASTILYAVVRFLGKIAGVRSNTVPITPDRAKRALLEFEAVRKLVDTHNATTKVARGVAKVSRNLDLLGRYQSRNRSGPTCGRVQLGVAPTTDDWALVNRYCEVLQSRPEHMLHPISLLPASKNEIKRALVRMSRQALTDPELDGLWRDLLRMGYSYLALFVPDHLARLDLDFWKSEKEYLSQSERFKKGETIAFKSLADLLQDLPPHIEAHIRAVDDFFVLGMEFDRLTVNDTTPSSSSSAGA